MEILIAQYGHIGYQKDGNEMIYRMIGFDLKNVYVWIFFLFFFFFFFNHSDVHFRSLWTWPLTQFSKFNRVRASALSSHLAKNASKSVHPFDWNFVHKNSAGQTDRHTHTQTDRQTEVKYVSSMISWWCKKKTSTNEWLII